jgi:hypothetical protein
MLPPTVTRPGHARPRVSPWVSPGEYAAGDPGVSHVLGTGGDRPKAAAVLGISRATIYRKITAYGIVVDPD